MPTAAPGTHWLNSSPNPTATKSPPSGRSQLSGQLLQPIAMRDLETSARETRYSTGFPDLDVVLGGGILAGSVSLLAGQPRHRQVHYPDAKSVPTSPVVTPSSTSPVRNPPPKSSFAPSVSAPTPTSLNSPAAPPPNDIAKTIATGDFNLVIVDSIQTLTIAEISSAPGGVAQVTNCGNLIIRAAKSSNTAVIIVGHVTKEGTLAGPKVLEHLVDVVLNFEGDRYGGFKVIRAVKNRFGSTSEAAIFAMGKTGLSEVKNPSATLLAETSQTPTALSFLPP